METKTVGENYCIDKEGNVYSRPRFGSKGGLVKKWVHRNGYWNVRLTIGGITTNHKLHRLIAGAFIPNPKKLPQINHKDGNKINNKIENLEWCTASENLAHAYRIGLRKVISATGEKYIYWEITTKKYRVIISKNKRKIRLGRFNYLCDAIKIRDENL